MIWKSSKPNVITANEMNICPMVQQRKNLDGIAVSIDHGMKSQSTMAKCKGKPRSIKKNRRGSGEELRAHSAGDER